MTNVELYTARLGNGNAVHLADKDGILCNRWGSMNGKVLAPKPIPGPATCKTCLKLAAK